MVSVPKPLWIATAREKRKNFKKEAIKLARQIGRHSGVCAKCGKSSAAGWRIEGAHIISVSFPNIAADPYNILPLCSYCHTLGKHSAHKSPDEFKSWVQEKYPGRYELLWAIANTKKKNDWQLIYLGLKNEYKKIQYGG